MDSTLKSRPSTTSPSRQRSLLDGSGNPLLNITDVRNPRPPKNQKFVPELKDKLATTFGKAGREASKPIPRSSSAAPAFNNDSGIINSTFGSAAAAGAGAAAVRSKASTPLGTDTTSSAAYSSLRSSAGVYSSWGAPRHAVSFNGTVDLSTLLGRRKAQQIENYSVEDDALNRKETNRFLTGSSGRGSIDIGKTVTVTTTTSKQQAKSSSKGGVVDQSANPQLLLHPRLAHRQMQGKRNLSATSMLEGRPVSTFGGPGREHTRKAPLSERQYPGPGQYHYEKPKERKEKGTLVGGMKDRGQIVMTKKGLVTEAPPPRTAAATSTSNRSMNKQMRGAGANPMNLTFSNDGRMSGTSPAAAMNQSTSSSGTAVGVSGGEDHNPSTRVVISPIGDLSAFSGGPVDRSAQEQEEESFETPQRKKQQTRLASSSRTNRLNSTATTQGMYKPQDSWGTTFNVQLKQQEMKKKRIVHKI